MSSMACAAVKGLTASSTRNDMVAYSQGSISEPRHVGRRTCPGEAHPADETVVEKQACKCADPETEGIQAREGHVARAHHERHQVIAKTEQDGHAHQEHHGGAMHGEQPVKACGTDKGVMRKEQLRPDHQRFEARNEEENQCIPDVKHAQL